MVHAVFVDVANLLIQTIPRVSIETTGTCILFIMCYSVMIRKQTND